jgi:integral membrane sensor domain MASE1
MSLPERLASSYPSIFDPTGTNATSKQRAARLGGWLRYRDLLWRMPLLCLVYVCGAVVSRHLSLEAVQAPMIWLPSGLSLAALPILGPIYWPAIFLGQLLSGILFSIPLVQNIVTALGITRLSRG